MRSGIYDGWVHHLRQSPQRHEFQYRLGMLMVDLDEWSTLFRGCWGWSTDRLNLATLRRRDHMGDVSEDLSESVRRFVRQSGGGTPRGRILMLTQPAYFGYVINPVSFYFCFDDGPDPVCVVAEVNNTPWGEQHCYLLEVGRQDLAAPVVRKAMHVSPFLPMSMGYGWQMDWESSRLNLGLSCFEGDEPVLRVSLSMRRHAWSAANLRRLLVRHPLMTWRIAAGIYSQAFRLWRKGVPFHDHPRRQGLDRLARQRTLA